MAPIRRVVLDVLKPHDPDLVEFTSQLYETGNVDTVTGTLVEIDENVKTIEVEIEGQDLEYGVLRRAIEDLGGSVHSIDQVVCGEQADDRR